MCLTLCRLLFQEESSGFLSACLSVGLLLSIRLQTHASVNVQPVGWEVRRAGDKPLPVFGCRAALHHPHQAQHLQEQLELGRYELRAALGTSVPAGTVLIFLFFSPTLLPLQRVLARVWSARTVSKHSAGRSSWAWCRPSSRPDWTQCGSLTPWSPLASALFTFPWRTSFAAR